MQAQEEPVWLKAITKVLEYDTECSPEINGIYTVNCRSLHLHLKCRRSPHRGLRGRYSTGWSKRGRYQACQERVVKQVRYQGPGEAEVFPGDDRNLKQRTGSSLDGSTNVCQNTAGEGDCKPVGTLVDVSSKLVKATGDEVSVDQPLYQSAVGSLMYLSVCSRPDIAYAVNTLAKFSSKPTQKHWPAVKRVFRYLNGTAEYGILFKKGESEECIGYSDSDWAGDQDDRKSTSGYIFQSASGAIS